MIFESLCLRIKLKRPMFFMELDSYGMNIAMFDLSIFYIFTSINMGNPNNACLSTDEQLNTCSFHNGQVNVHKKQDEMWQLLKFIAFLAKLNFLYILKFKLKENLTDYKIVALMIVTTIKS